MKKGAFLLLFVMVKFIFTGSAQTTINGFASVNGTTLFYEVSGEGTPIIFLHGAVCDHRNWNAQTDFFSKYFKVVTFDARGFGVSSVPDTVTYSMIDDLDALMDFLNIKKAILVGHSMGGGTAFFYTLQHPDKVISLVLAEGGPDIRDPNLIDINKYNNYIKEDWGVSLKSITKEKGFEFAKQAWLNINPIKPSAENPLSREIVLAMTNDYSGWHWKNIDPRKRNPLCTREMLNRIKVPTLLLVGAKSHEGVKEYISDLDSLIPISRKVIIENSNHMFNNENPEQFNKELLIFLKENNF